MRLMSEYDRSRPGEGVPSAIAEIIRDFLIFVAVLFTMLIVFVSVFPNMLSGNPMKRLLTVLNYRVGAAAAAAPINPVHAEKAV